MYAYKYVCLCECLLTVLWGYLLRPENGVDLLKLVLQAVVNSFCGFWELNLGPLEGQCVLITAKRFL